MKLSIDKDVHIFSYREKVTGGPISLTDFHTKQTVHKNQTPQKIPNITITTKARSSVFQSLYLSVYLAAVFSDLSLDTPVEKKIP